MAESTLTTLVARYVVPMKNFRVKVEMESPWACHNCHTDAGTTLGIRCTSCLTCGVVFFLCKDCEAQRSVCMSCAETHHVRLDAIVQSL